MVAKDLSAQVPEWFTRLCKINLNNSRNSFSDIADIIQEDPFLKVYVNYAFADYLKKGGLLGMLTAIGWQGLRNRLAEAILHKISYGDYPVEIELDLIESTKDLEQRFSFLFVEGNSRLFLLGVFLQINEFLNEENSQGFLSIPVELDEAIVDLKNKSELPDWLIFSMMALISVLGEEKAIGLIAKNKADIDKTLSSLDQSQRTAFFELMLTYGKGIRDYDFFLESKVI